MEHEKVGKRNFKYSFCCIKWPLLCNRTPSAQCHSVGLKASSIEVFSVFPNTLCSGYLRLKKKQIRIWVFLLFFFFFSEYWSIKHVQRLPFGRFPAVIFSFFLSQIIFFFFFSQGVILLLSRKGHAYIKKNPKPIPVHQSLKLLAKCSAWVWYQLCYFLPRKCCDLSSLNPSQPGRQWKL